MLKYKIIKTIRNDGVEIWFSYRKELFYWIKLDISIFEYILGININDWAYKFSSFTKEGAIEKCKKHAKDIFSKQEKYNRTYKFVEEEIIILTRNDV
jgi:hypothetical protein